MHIQDLFLTGLKGISAHKLRSVLTTIGIVIGVGTVVSMVSIIEGVNRFVYNAFGSVGSNVIYIQKWKWSFVVGSRGRGWWRELKDRKDLTIEDEKAISQLPGIEKTASTFPIFRIGEISYKKESINVENFGGVTPDYLSITGRDIERGRNFISADNEFRKRVCIIGPYIAENLFEDEDPLNKEVIIGGKRFTIIGITEKKGELLGNNLDNFVLVPLETALSVFKGKRKGAEWMKIFQSLQILASVKQGYSMEKAQEQIRELLRIRRNIPFTEEDDFALNTQEMLLSLYRSLTVGIFIAMIGIASLALIVGGIGIMNIMLVSVSERTKEIGIRMAVGAKRKDILLQFLFESIVLTAIGGFLGLVLGASLAKLVDILTPLPSYIPLWSFLVAVGFSTVVGVFFGIYPATVASKMDPISALRYE